MNTVERINALITYLLRKAPRRLYRTQIVKMCYLFEYYYTQKYGRPFLEASFVRHFYGPFAVEVYRSLDHLVDTGAINEKKYNDTFYYSLYNPPEEHTLEHTLDDEVKPIADFVVRELSSLSYHEMINYVYATPPMQEILESENATGYRTYGRRLDMNRTRDDVIRRFTVKDLLAARKRRNSQPDRGDRYSYIQETHKELCSLRKLRERANKCLDW